MIAFGLACRPIRFSLCVICLVYALACESLQGDDWPQWRGPNRNGISSETDWTHTWPEGGPRVAWRAELGTGFSSVVVSQGRLCTVGNKDDVDTIWCFDAESGKKIWSHSYDSPLDDRFFEGGPTSTPTFDGDFLYALSRQGDLFCLEASSGKVSWSKNIAEETSASIPGWGFASSPVVHGDSLIVGIGEAATAVNKRNGELIWTSDKGEAGYMTPFPLKLDGEWKVLVASGRAYQLVDLTTGQFHWKHRWLTTYGCNAADPIVEGSRVFISSGYNRGASLLAVNAQAAKPLWSSKEMQNQMNPSVKIGEAIYGFSGNDTGEASVKCIDFESGKTRWQSDDLPLGSVMAAGDHLIILCGDGELIIAPATPKQFEPVARAQILTGKCWTVPVLAHGHLYCRNAEGQLVGLDLRQP